MAHDIDTIALEAAERIMQISFQPMLGGAPQLKAKIQCEVRTALAALANPSMIIVRPQAPVEHVSIKSVIGAPSSQTDASSDDLLDRLQRAIDEAEHKPGQWAQSLMTMGGIITFETFLSARLQPDRSWGSFSYKRDAWLAIAAVNALPELMDRLRRTEQGERAADQEVERLRAEMERLRMQLAACGVVAMANTPESAAKARDMHPEYRSASCDDVAQIVDKEMAQRAEVERLRRELERLRGLYDDGPVRESLIAFGWTPPDSATPTTACCGDPGDCAQPCEAERKPSAKTAQALEQAREIRERLAGDELPDGLSWDQAPWWATVLVRHLDGQHAWAAAYANGAKADAADGDGAVTRLGAISEYWTLIATRPTQKAPCTDCGACVGGPHGCGKPGLHGKAEPDEDGWIKWEGGKCPLPEGTLVDVRYRSGEQKFGIPCRVTVPGYEATAPFWRNDNQRADIIAYRLHRPATPRRDATQN